MTGTACTAPDCDRKVVARGLCTLHYQRLMRNGTLDLLPVPTSTWVVMHKRLRRMYGRASEHLCVDCGARAEEWSYQHQLGCQDEKPDPNGRGPFCPHPEHYVPRCKACHGAHDAGTMPRGEAHHRAVLTDDLVREARKMYASGQTYVQISEALGVPYQTIGHAVTGRRWKHVT